jgi:hypothetical protein
MQRTSRYLAILVIALGLASMAIGIGFIVEGQAKLNFMKEAMRLEKITLGIPAEELAEGNIVDTAVEAQNAGDVIREHRRGIAPTYNELLGGERFDPDNPQHVTYMQALNLENYLYMSVAAFGLVTVVQLSGVALIVIGIALAATGFLLGIMRKRLS